MIRGIASSYRCARPRRPPVGRLLWRAVGALAALTYLLLGAADPALATVVRIESEGGRLDPELRAYIEGEARRGIDDLRERLGIAPPDSMRIVLCVTAGTFARYAGSARFLGVAHPGRAVVALNMSILEPGPERSLTGTLRHELAHLVIGEAADGAFIPRWFNEGVASWVGGRFTELGAVESERLTGASWLHLERLAVTFPAAPDRMRLAYTKSLFAVEFLERSMPGAVGAILERVDSGEDFEQALAGVSGLTVGELDRATREQTRLTWLRNSAVRFVASPYGWLAVLVIVGFILRRLRFRRRLARWVEEEER